MIERAEFWMRARQYRRARAEYEALAKQLGGRERELARVRVGAALFRDYDTSAAWDYLRSFEAADPEVEAERLYWLVECARRMGRDAEMAALVERLERLHPRSPWRMRALVAAGNRYLLDNQPEQYLPLFRACAEAFREDPESRNCHWKLAWRSYLERRPEAAQWLREHLLRYPASEHAPAALYFLGRLAEAQGRPGHARAWYEAVEERFPGYYYAARARQRLAHSEAGKAQASAEVKEFLSRLAWPGRATGDGFRPSETMRLRVARARLLKSAGLPEAADEELKFSAATDGQPYLAALEWAELMKDTAPVHQILRTVKQLAPGHLNLRLEEAPKRFWQILFPFPHRGLIETYARRH
ncbi:MAG: tetratricopeptide repeat protein, partial [Bryobacteraceae bacterium]